MATDAEPSLRLMRPDEFDVFRRRIEADHARNLAFARQISPGVARAMAEERVAIFLPDGLSTKNQFLYSIMLTGESAPIGSVWYRLQDHHGEFHAYLMELVMEEAFRGEGIGSSSLRLVEERARKSGAVSLHVDLFFHNNRGKSLLQELGYLPAELGFSKRLA